MQSKWRQEADSALETDMHVLVLSILEVLSACTGSIINIKRWRISRSHRCPLHAAHRMDGAGWWNLASLRLPGPASADGSG